MDFFMTYIVPVLIVLGISAIFAFILAFLGEKLKVEVDPRIDKVRAHLPGINCGGCGFASCDAYARALIEGKAKVGDCNPTPDDDRAVIAELLHVEALKVQRKVAAVYCAGTMGEASKGIYHGHEDCTSENIIAGGVSFCEQGCLGGGTCVQACNYGALSMDEKRGVPVVDEDVCIACGACTQACPKKLIGLIPVSAKAHVACSCKSGGKQAIEQCTTSCSSCGLCAKNCPVKAIKVEGNLARIDYGKCNGCSLCATKCPRKCIVAREYGTDNRD
ncbi:MAG: RnfABCDGE type electron transport complex subunit B [Firmicutes bacterium]|nr:RnfABCDGE type electron transport complex subunit B [Bacillota bacterium]